MDGPDCNQNDRKFLHPKQSANCLSKLFFCWIFPSFVKGFKRTFKETDLLPLLKQHESTSLGDKLEGAWALEKLSNYKFSLWRPLLKIFGKEFLKIGINVFINEFIIKLSQPIFIWKLLTIKENNLRETEAYVYGSLLVISSFANAILYNWYIFNLRNLSMKVRIACSSLIYRKSLKLNKNNISKTATGQIVNLLSNDLSRFDKLFLQIHYLWAAPLEALIILCLLYVMLDPKGTLGISLFFAFIPIQLYMGKKYSDFRLETAIKTDERVRLINEILSGIQVIKMYTWEKIFIKFTNSIRKQEIRYIRKTSYLKALQNAFNKFLSKGALFLCVMVYIFTGNRLQSQYVFVIKSFYNLLQNNMTTNFPEAIKNIAEASVSVKRIEQFLLYNEIKHNKTQEMQPKKGVYLEKISARWSSAVSDTLSEISFEATLGQLVTIVGTVGSGKTSLINVILHELPLAKGRINIAGNISYASQEPWLFGGTIKQNILFGQPLDDVKYEEVVNVCALNHDFELLPYGDNSIVGDRGITLSGGQKARINLARAVYRNADIYLLDDPLSAVDASVGKQLFNECILNYLKNKCVVLVTHQLQYLKKSDIIYLLKNGKIIASGNYEHIRNCGEDFATLLNKEVEYEDNSTDNAMNQKLLNQKEEKQFYENRSFGTIPLKVYFSYLLSGGWCASSVIVIMFIVSQSLLSGVDYFESYWVNLEEKKGEVTQSEIINTDNCIYIYSALILMFLMFTILTSISFFAYFMKVSIKIHNKMFTSIIKATINFFYTNPSGSILNRFSKDMGVVDTIMPKLLIDAVEIILNSLAVFVIVALVNPWMLVSSIILLFFFYFIRIIYLATSREVKRIEATSRSPVYSQLNESLQGLETIRAFGVETKQIKKFDNILNHNTSACYMYIALNTTFGFWLDLFCCVYLALVTANCFWSEDINKGDIGLIITQAIGLTTMFQWGIKQWSEFENEMTSVERIAEYIGIESEKDENAKETWPRCNDIQFKSVTLKYKKDIPAALNNLSFVVAPKEKIGIVGRTGAGKTSIISALFRLVRFEGCILIGGVDINKVPLQTMRSKISIIPQDPVLFSGSVRENLDPFNQFEDAKLWSILDELDLKNFVSNLPAGLGSQILEKGSNLSVGQRQLFCLARALLRGNKILVLDEVTANVDLRTDSLIQLAIKTKLVDCTVLIIAHRLHTIMNCDKVLVMGAGRILEYDHPHRLLANENGALHNLVLKTGHCMTNHLKKVAEQNYTENSESTHL